jgi:hypothetical protein
VELLGQLAEFDLFASKKSDVTLRKDRPKYPAASLRATIERILANTDGNADQRPKLHRGDGGELPSCCEM